MRIIRLILLAMMITAPAANALAAERGQTHVRALLVIASKSSGERGRSDDRLAEYEPTLRRILRFESFRLAGEGSANVPPTGRAIARLARGHLLELEQQPSDRGGIQLRVRWQEGARVLMGTVLSFQPGVPVVLGGPSTGTEGEAWAVIVIAN